MYKGLTNEELFKLKNKGNLEVRDFIITNNMNLVYKVANKFKNATHVDFESVIQEGMVGLIKSVDKFNLDLDLKFSSYAYKTIEGTIRNHIRDFRIDVPYRVKQYDLEIYKQISEVNKSYLSTKEIALRLGIEQSEIERVLTIFKSHKSITLNQQDEENNKEVANINIIKDNSQLTQDDISKKIDINNCISKLDKEHRKVIELKYFKDMTQSEIAQITGVSQSGVCLRVKAALKELRKII